MKRIFAFPSLVVLIVTVAIAGGCSSQDDRVGFVTPPDGGGFASPDASVEPASSPAGLCLSRDCVAPYATCPDATYLCSVNLDNDDDNCGGCAIKCPGRGQPLAETVLSADWKCNSGRCAMNCLEGFSDCNGNPGDGCEVSTLCDPKNCGGCGHECPAGVGCLQGQCGCSPGLTLCGANDCSTDPVQGCKDLDQDSQNCGACNNPCPYVDGLPPNAGIGCQKGKCDALACFKPYLDCNNDLQTPGGGDGCETNPSADPMNCGACGNVCDPGRFCSHGTCLCQPGAERCGTQKNPTCFFLDTDPDNCGGCGRVCPGPKASYDEKALHESRTCRFGHCSLECAAGYADCDGDSQNGCEAATNVDPNNCGGCGIQCDVGAGQPCANGTCAVGPCSGGPVR